MYFDIWPSQSCAWASGYSSLCPYRKRQGVVSRREKAGQRKSPGRCKASSWIARTSGDTRQTKDLLFYKWGSQDQHQADSIQRERALCPGTARAAREREKDASDFAVPSSAVLVCWASSTCDQKRKWQFTCLCAELHPISWAYLAIFLGMPMFPFWNTQRGISSRKEFLQLPFTIP